MFGGADLPLLFPGLLVVGDFGDVLPAHAFEHVEYLELAGRVEVLLRHVELPDGERRQTGNTSTMIFSIPHIVAYISQFMTLNPGDVFEAHNRFLCVDAVRQLQAEV